MKLVLLSVIMFASEASACSCMMPSNQDAFCFADFVSHIKIKSIETIEDDFSLHYTVEHLDIYKAPSSAPLSCDIYTSASSASCGIDGLVIGQELLVIGSIDENQKQRIYICGQFQEGIYWNDIPASFKKQLKAGFKCPATTRATRY